MGTNVLPLKLGIVNSFLLTSGNTCPILVDTGNSGDHKKIVRGIEKAGYRPQDISLVVLTHGHMDHAGGVYEFSRISGAKVIVRKRDAPLVRGEKAPDFSPVGLKGKVFKSLIPVVERLTSESKRKSENLELEELDEEEINLEGFGVDGRILTTPGHTAGSLSVALRNGSVIVGDLVMGRFFSFGRASYPPFVSDMELLKRSIKKILDLDPDTIYASHGGPYTPDDLRKLV